MESRHQSKVLLDNRIRFLGFRRFSRRFRMEMEGSTRMWVLDISWLDLVATLGICQHVFMNPLRGGQPVPETWRTETNALLLPSALPQKRRMLSLGSRVRATHRQRNRPWPVRRAAWDECLNVKDKNRTVLSYKPGLFFI